MAVLKRDIERKKALLSPSDNQTPHGSTKRSAEPIVLSSDEEGSPLMKKPKLSKHHVDNNGVIHVDSDSDVEEVEATPQLSKRSSAPHGISLSALKGSPAGGAVVDLTTMTDDLDPSPLEVVDSSIRPQKRGSISLRLDLSSDGLRGMPFSDQPPSPVTLAPRTARPQSAHPSSLASGNANPFFPPPGADASMLPHLMSTTLGPPPPPPPPDFISSGSVAMLDLASASAPPSGRTGVLLDLTAVPPSEAHQMDLDLFGDVVDTSSNEGGLDLTAIGGDGMDTDAAVSEQPDIHQLLAQAQQTSQLTADLNDAEAAMSLVSGEPTAPSGDTAVGVDEAALLGSFTDAATLSDVGSFATSLAPALAPGATTADSAAAEPASSAPITEASEAMSDAAGTSITADSLVFPDFDPSSISLDTSALNPPAESSTAAASLGEYGIPGIDGVNLDDLDFSSLLKTAEEDGGAIDLGALGDMDFSAMLSSFDDLGAPVGGTDGAGPSSG
ncbi:hypothetical protein DL93DRAFT_2084093 [Clavulina sp. PMI_390]|nr:hypothetical protein DL93DRAFT_2084093 [Clavulina sp. PMI_390]